MNKQTALTDSNTNQQILFIVNHKQIGIHKSMFHVKHFNWVLLKIEDNQG